MKKLTKGAFAMVLAGSVTFSVANALLVNTTPKRLIEETALAISADRKNADVINQEEKKVKDQTPTTNVKGHDIVAVQVSSKNSNMAIAAIQTNRKNSSNRTTTNPANTKKTTTRTSAATPISVASTKVPTKTPTPTPTRTDTTSAT